MVYFESKSESQWTDVKKLHVLMSTYFKWYIAFHMEFCIFSLGGINSLQIMQKPFSHKNSEPLWELLVAHQSEKLCDRNVSIKILWRTSGNGQLLATLPYVVLCISIYKVKNFTKIIKAKIIIKRDKYYHNNSRAFFD